MSDRHDTTVEREVWRYEAASGSVVRLVIKGALDSDALGTLEAYVKLRRRDKRQREQIRADSDRVTSAPTTDPLMGVSEDA